MRPTLHIIQSKRKSGQSCNIDLPRTDSRRPVYYYNSQNITDKVAAVLDQLVFQGFSSELMKQRKNASFGKSCINASSIKSVDERLKELIPVEYEIYQLGLDSQ